MMCLWEKAFIHVCIYVCGTVHTQKRHVCPCMCMYRLWYESSLILDVCVCQCMYRGLVGSPCHAFWNLPCGCSTEQLLSPQRLSLVFCSHSSQDLALCFCLFLFSLFISRLMSFTASCSCYFHLFHKGIYMDVHLATPLRPHYSTQTFTDSALSRFPLPTGQDEDIFLASSISTVFWDLQV